MSLSGKSNIEPKLWGPYFWQTFHFTAFGYPINPNEIDKETYKTFYISFMKTLPCDKCSESSQEILNSNLSDLEKGLKSKEHLIKWSYFFHDKVNKKLNTKSPSFEDFKDNFINRKDSKLFYIMLIILVLVLGYVFIRYTSDSL